MGMTTTKSIRGRKFELISVDSETGEMDDIITHPATYAKTIRERDDILSRGLEDEEDGGREVAWDRSMWLVIREYA